MIWCRFFISKAFAIMPLLYAQVHIPIRKGDFVLCTVHEIGSAMHLNVITVIIALASGKWGIIYTISS